MNTVTFYVVLVCSIIAAVTLLTGLVQLYRRKPVARNTFTIGFGVWLLGIVLAAILFGFFTV